VALRPEYLYEQTQDELQEVTNKKDLAPQLEGMMRGATTLPAPEPVVDPFLMQAEIHAEEMRNGRNGGTNGMGPVQNPPPPPAQLLPDQPTAPAPVKP